MFNNIKNKIVMEERLDPQKSYSKWLSAIATAILVLTFAFMDLATGKPCIEQTAFFGPTQTTNYTALYVDEDDSTRIIGLRYCAFQALNDGTGRYQHFRGFEAVIKSDTKTFIQTYGTLDETAANTKCETFVVDEEIMYITVY